MSSQLILPVKQSQAHPSHGQGTWTQPIGGKYVIEFGATFKATIDISESRSVVSDSLQPRGL